MSFISPILERTAITFVISVRAHFHQNDELKTTMEISKRLIDLDLTRFILCNAIQGLITSLLEQFPFYLVYFLSYSSAQFPVAIENSAFQI